MLFAFRVFFLLAFLVAALKLGDWKNWQKYYPTILFVMAINLGASLLSYHHVLWDYNPDTFVKTATTVELINSFIMLPATTFVYLSKFPTQYKLTQYSYMLLWVTIYGVLEFIDHYIMKGLSYKHGWSWSTSVIFDVAMFAILRLHYLKPIWAWGASLVVAIVIIIMFDFFTGEFK